MTNPIHNKKHLEQFRKNLRNHLTPAEAALWKHLQKSQLGQKFRRQHSVKNYILDFYCPQSRIGIELDGHHHFTETGMAKDVKRDAALKELNITVIRIENSDVFGKLPDVLMKIKQHLK